MSGAAKKTREPSALVDWIDGHLNAVLVKDIRAWLHSKKFLFVFFLSMILIQGTTFVLTVIDEPERGGILFTVLMGGLGVVLVGVLPYLMHDRFTDELASGSTELALISRMTPGMLVRGKIASGLAASLLFFSAAGPSFTIAYMLGGLSIIVLVYSIALLVFMAVIAMIAAILLVAITGKRKLKILGLLLIFGGLNGSGGLIGLGAALAEESFKIGTNFWIANLIAVAYISLFAVFFYTVAVSRLSFEADNRDVRPRLSLSALSILPVLLTFVSLMGATVIGLPHSDADEIMAVVVGSSLSMFVFGCLFILSTPARMSARIKSKATKFVPFRMLFYPGEGRLYFYILLHLAFFAVAAFLPAAWRFDDEVTSVLFTAPVVVVPVMLGGCTLLHFLITKLPFLEYRKVPRGLVVGLLLFLWSMAVFPVIAVVEGADIDEVGFVVHPLSALGYVGDEGDPLAIIITMVVHSIVGIPAMIYWAVRIFMAFREEMQLLFGKNPKPIRVMADTDGGALDMASGDVEPSTDDDEEPPDG